MSDYNEHELISHSEDQMPSPAAAIINDGRKYVIECNSERVVRAVDDKVMASVWFQTEPLKAAFINRIQSIRLITESHDQGFVGDPLEGNWTWFELSILANEKEQRPKSEGQLALTWESHRNLMESSTYGTFEGKKFKSQHDLLRFLEDGDVIAVRLCAQFPAWEIHARKGRLIIEMSQTEIHREAPKYAPYVTEMKAMERIFVEVNEVTQPKEMGSFIPRLPLALFRADAFDTGDERPLRVLSLDGGGVRGLASLHILNAVMKKASPGKKPCEVFDMIGGTSTGGLIAIMLGRLKMTVDECIQTYQELMGDIFCGSKYLGYLWRGDFYSAENIEKAIKKLIKQRIDDEEAPLIDEDSKCKIFVTATFEHAANNRGPLILRSYTNKQVKSELPTIKLWQAARATSAAPAYFKPIDVDGYKLVDGGLGANNPLGWLWTEVLSVFGPVRKTDCFLSIGTGIEANKAVEQPGRVPTFGTIRSYACIATNAELTHILFRGLIDAFAPRPRTPKYWRLNVSKEIPAWDETKKKWVFWSEKVHHHADYEDMIELDDTSGARSKLMDMTKEYLSRKDVEESIKACAEALRAHLA